MTSDEALLTPGQKATALHAALDRFGRTARKLSVARLLDTPVVIEVLGSAHQLRHQESRYELAVRVEQALRSVIDAITDSVDRRIAQAVLATEPEFHDKNVTARKRFVAENDLGFSDEQYKTRRRRIIADVAEALARAMDTQPDDAPTKVNHAPPATALETGENNESPAETNGRLPLTSSRRWWWVSAAAVVTTVVVAVIVSLRHASTPEQTWNGMTAAQLEARYDGRDPRGYDSEDSRCADPPKSEVVPGSSMPPVMRPGGGPVGELQLRRSPICPTIVWARLLWDGNEDSYYRIPAGWTLHVVMHRPATDAALDEPEPAGASDVPYALSGMISSARGCVYAEAYFTSPGSSTTTRASTSCVSAS